MGGLRSLNDPVSERIIGACIEVHRQLGPGLLESAYEHCLSLELGFRGIPFRQQVALPVAYKGVPLEHGYRLDLLVGESIVVEVKAVERILPVHVAQTLTYLRLGDYPVGLLVNFKEAVLWHGVRRLTPKNLRRAPQLPPPVLLTLDLSARR